MIKTKISGVIFMASSSHRQTIAAARRPSRTPSNGLETANQKQKSQRGSSAGGFVFMLIPQAPQHRYFTKREILCAGFERSTQHDCFAIFIVESTSALRFRCKRRESPNERLHQKGSDNQEAPLECPSRRHAIFRPCVLDSGPLQWSRPRLEGASCK